MTTSAFTPPERLPVLLSPPLGPHAKQAADILRQHGWQIVDPGAAQEIGRPVPRLFLVDLTTGLDPGHLCTPRTWEPTPGQGFILVVERVDASLASTVCSLGPCAFWEVSEPPETLVARVTALEAMTLQAHRRARVQAMAPLFRVAQFFGDMTDLDQLLHRVLQTALEETGADRGSIMLLDETGEQLFIAVAVGLPEDIVRLERQRVGEGIAGWVAAQRRPLVLTEGEIPPFAATWLRGRNAFSSASVPMMHQGELIGVLNVTKRPGKRPFQEGDVELLTVLAQQAAAAIRVARLFSQIEDAYERLQNLDRLRTQLVDILAHEMRTPVTVLKGYMELIADLDPDEVRQAVTAMTRHLQRLDVLVRDLFRLSTLERLEKAPRLRPVSIPEWAEGLRRKFEPLASTAGLRFEVHVAPGLDKGLMDPDHVAEILGYLVENACKFTPPGGRVAIRVEGEAHMLRVHVDDSGPGIPEEERPRVFREFYQVEELSTREHEGLGIGLTIARALARAHGGTLLISDSPLGGARVTLELPHVLSPASDRG